MFYNSSKKYLTKIKAAFKNVTINTMRNCDSQAHDRS